MGLVVDKVIALVKPLSAFLRPFRAIPERLTGCAGVGYLFVSPSGSTSFTPLALRSLAHVYLRLFLDG
ncbi:hypothetical protein CrRp3_cds6 [Citrobacter phage vB_CroP_CrRp3]|uniref:Uncharacterized protein n=1 Tax=Citrobacter phage vB_CroP_CrRp3 TaxID=2079275 RepID=A0A2R4PAK3_9CAUD|nr:hypothetical protein HOS73_gp06 [Citrobacter phage vB_CroP_CrRp3]AVX48073.1 hypothetical protein CrRp3_cds6 [Citrobacter phage vB_CroP_CrRp3]